MTGTTRTTRTTRRRGRVLLALEVRLLITRFRSGRTRKGQMKPETPEDADDEYSHWEEVEVPGNFPFSVPLHMITLSPTPGLADEIHLLATLAVKFVPGTPSQEEDVLSVPEAVEQILAPSQTSHSSRSGSATSASHGPRAPKPANRGTPLLRVSHFPGMHSVNKSHAGVLII